MQTREIQQRRWPSFFDNFSRKHDGWSVALEVFGPDLGCQVEQNGLTLGGITDEWNEINGDRITIMTGSKPADHVTHAIAQPTTVRLERTDDGADLALEIKSADGTTTLLRFC